MEANSSFTVQVTRSQDAELRAVLAGQWGAQYEVQRKLFGYFRLFTITAPPDRMERVRAAVAEWQAEQQEQEAW